MKFDADTLFRNCEAVTCVDCSVTFYGNDYEQHTSCVSEAQKYEGALYKAKKAKLNPQDAWVALIEEVSANTKEAPVALQQHLARLGELNNVPRNKNKFVNFCKNSLKLYNDKLLESLFDYLDQKRAVAVKDEPAKQAPPVKAVESTQSAVVAEEISKDKKSKKDKKDKKDKHESEEPAKEAAPVVEESVEEESKEKKKKSKKEKKEKSEEDPAVVEVTDEQEEASDSKEKKKKSKKRKHENSEE